MKKLIKLSVFLILIALTLCNASHLSGQTNQGTASSEQSPDAQRPPNSAPATNSESDKNAENAKHEPQHWYASPEWWLVIVAIPTLIVVGWQAIETARAAKATKIAAEATQSSTKTMVHQLNVMMRQTEAMETAAAAASLNADALVNSERAWVIAGVKRYQQTATAFSLSVTNHGRTPARLIWYEREFSLIPSTGTTLSDANERQTHRNNRQIFVAVGKPSRLELFDIPTELGMEVWNQIRTGKTTLACSGQIHYLDLVSGKSRDTWFSYSYNVSRHVFSADGLPPESNRYT